MCSGLCCITSPALTMEEAALSAWRLLGFSCWYAWSHYVNKPRKDILWFPVTNQHQGTALGILHRPWQRAVSVSQHVSSQELWSSSIPQQNPFFYDHCFLFMSVLKIFCNYKSESWAFSLIYSFGALPSLKPQERHFTILRLTGRREESVFGFVGSCDKAW